MPRKPLIRSHDLPYHVCSRAHNREPFPVPLEDAWRMAKSILLKTHTQYSFELHAFVLMSNHYHMLLTTPSGNIDQIMYEFNRRLSLQLRIITGNMNQQFGGRYKWKLVTDINYLQSVIAYIYQNPVRAGLTETVEAYPYSTFHCHIHEKHFPIPLSLLGDEFSNTATPKNPPLPLKLKRDYLL